MKLLLSLLLIPILGGSVFPNLYSEAGKYKQLGDDEEKAIKFDQNFYKTSDAVMLPTSSDLLPQQPIKRVRRTLHRPVSNITKEETVKNQHQVLNESGTRKSAEEEQELSESSTNFIELYPEGLGPVLMSDCLSRHHSASQCCTSRLTQTRKTTCQRLLDSVAFVGIGFDGRGYYKIASRKSSLVQRVCNDRVAYKGRSVPDNMDVYGVYETKAVTKAFSSLSDYMKHITKKAGLSSQKNLFKSEFETHSESSEASYNFWIAKGHAKYNRNSESRQSSSSHDSQRSENSSSNMQSGRKHSFMAVMEVDVILYEIVLDQARPTDLSVPLLKDFISLPASYYSNGADVKYQNFLLRWGTHYIRSAKFGGQLKVIKTAKSSKSVSADEFASQSQKEFGSMLSKMEKTSKSIDINRESWFSKNEYKMSRRSGKSDSESNSYSSRESESSTSKSSQSSEFTQTNVEAEGGTPEIAESLSNFYTPNFRPLFHRWISSISENPKPFEFKLDSIHNLFDINMDDLFLSSKADWGECCDKNGNATSRKPACKYRNIEEFKKDLERRRLSLEKAIAVYMEEGPFPTSSFDLDGGQSGCTMVEDNKNGSNAPPSFKDIQRSGFILTFDLPADVEDFVSSQAKYIVRHRQGRWFATIPGERAHIFDGCRVYNNDNGNSGVESNANKSQICFHNVLLTYEEESGYLLLDAHDYNEAKIIYPQLPHWLIGAAVAKVALLPEDRPTVAYTPCNVKWSNSHQLDPTKNVSCVHFTAASDGEVFVVFAAVPKKQSTWTYIYITTEGVNFYQDTKEVHAVKQVGIGMLGDQSLFQSFFVCIVESGNNSHTLQFGKADPDSEFGSVHAQHTFNRTLNQSRPTFFAFGAGEKSVSLMDIRLTKRIPNVICAGKDLVEKDGACDIECHSECDGCIKARDSTACKACKNFEIRQENTTVIRCVSQCPTGTQPIGRQCKKCPKNTYKPAMGHKKCFKCPEGTRSEVGASQCTWKPGFVEREFINCTQSSKKFGDCHSAFAGRLLREGCFISHNETKAFWKATLKSPTNRGIQFFTHVNNWHDVTVHWTLSVPREGQKVTEFSQNVECNTNDRVQRHLVRCAVLSEHEVKAVTISVKGGALVLCNFQFLSY